MSAASHRQPRGDGGRRFLTWAGFVCSSWAILLMRARESTAVRLVLRFFFFFSCRDLYGIF